MRNGIDSGDIYTDRYLSGMMIAITNSKRRNCGIVNMNMNMMDFLNCSIHNSQRIFKMSWLIPSETDNLCQGMTQRLLSHRPNCLFDVTRHLTPPQGDIYTSEMPFSWIINITGRAVFSVQRSIWYQRSITFIPLRCPCCELPTYLTGHAVFSIQQSVWYHRRTTFTPARLSSSNYLSY